MRDERITSAMRYNHQDNRSKILISRRPRLLGGSNFFLDLCVLCAFAVKIRIFKQVLTKIAASIVASHPTANLLAPLH
jgi:hypothetical protein